MTRLKLLPIHRVSTALQAGDDGEGLDRQRDATNRLIKSTEGAEELPPVEIVDVSGSDVAASSEWQQKVLPVISAPDVHVAVDSIDRILRAESFNFRVMQDLLATGTHIHTPTKVHDLSKPEDGFLAGLMALIGGREKAEIKRRMMAGREAARRRGEWPLRESALPRGITYDRETKTWGYDEMDSEVVHRVFEDFVVEGKAMRTIARTIGKPMQTVRLYLRNPIYKGWLVYDECRGEAYPAKDGRQPHRKKIKRPVEKIIRVQVFGDPEKPEQLSPLVEPWKWEAAQRTLDQNSVIFIRKREQGRPDAWASGYIVSALSSRLVLEPGFTTLGFDTTPVMHAIYANGGSKTGRRYSCRCVRAHQDVRRCGFRNPEGHLVNQTLDAYLIGLTRDGWFLDAVRESLKQAGRRDDGGRANLEQRMAKLGGKEERLTNLYLDGRVARERHDRMQDGIRADREKIHRQLAALDAPGTLPTEADLGELEAKWAWHAEWGHQRKRDWLARYVVHLALSNDGVERALVKVPAGDEGMPVYISGRRLDWVVPVFSRAAPRRNRQ
jgi:DNA invertase Pin-like site-specific DNA recombinase